MTSIFINRAVQNPVYTGETHLRGLNDLDFLLVREGGLCLCSREFYSPEIDFVTAATLLISYLI